MIIGQTVIYFLIMLSLHIKRLAKGIQCLNKRSLSSKFNGLTSIYLTTPNKTCCVECRRDGERVRERKMKEIGTDKYLHFKCQITTIRS